jgi:hypothetical protein
MYAVIVVNLTAIGSVERRLRVLAESRRFLQRRFVEIDHVAALIRPVGEYVPWQRIIVTALAK